MSMLHVEYVTRLEKTKRCLALCHPIICSKAQLLYENQAKQNYVVQNRRQCNKVQRLVKNKVLNSS